MMFHRLEINITKLNNMKQLFQHISIDNILMFLKEINLFYKI